MKCASKVFGLFLALALTLVPGLSGAQNYPTKPIKFIVGYQPGGSNDILARIVGQKLSEQLGQPVIIDNKPGADARIASEFVAKSVPDGYTLLIGASGAMTLNPGLYAPLSYDPVKDFIPITLFAAAPLVFAVNPSHPAHSIKDLIAMAKAKPGELFYSSGAPPMYVAAEHFKKLAGVNIVNVPFKGSGPSIAATVAGEVPLTIAELPPALPQLKSGKLRPLAVTDTKRSPFLPDVPTVAESGLDFEGGMWVGLYAPAGTPRPIIDKLYSALATVLKSDSMKERLAALSYDTSGSGMTPAEFDAFFKDRLTRWTKVIKENDLRPQ
jgi:tripartite-type tricarboxylate transporter receptor subunit TctC